VAHVYSVNFNDNWVGALGPGEHFYWGGAEDTTVIWILRSADFYTSDTSFPLAIAMGYSQSFTDYDWWYFYQGLIEEPYPSGSWRGRQVLQGGSDPVVSFMIRNDGENYVNYALSGYLLTTN